jgi:hypothetical protein
MGRSLVQRSPNEYGVSLQMIRILKHEAAVACVGLLARGKELLNCTSALDCSLTDFSKRYPCLSLQCLICNIFLT